VVVMERIYVTPQHVYRVKDSRFVDLCLDNFEQVDYREGAGNYITSQDLHKTEVFKPVTEWLEAKGQELVDKLNIPGKFSLVAMWLTKSYPGQYLAPHAHPLSFISGSYYFTDKPTPVVLMHENLWQEYPLANGADVVTPLEVSAGDLIFIPSRMRHGVPPVEHTRSVLSFNAVLTDINTCSGRFTQTVETAPVME
jgi:hypothetical protein